MEKKVIYTKRIGISEDDIKYINSLKNEEIFKQKSRNGILAYIISYFKSNKQGKLF